MTVQDIYFGVSAMSNRGRIFQTDPDKISAELADEVLSRDEETCQFCGFRSAKYQKIQFLGEDAKAQKAEEYKTACAYCHQCFHIDQVDRMQSGVLIWLPEMSQAELNNLARAIYIARITQGPMADAARDALDLLMARKDEARLRLGTDEPRILATIFQDFMEPREYARRMKRLGGIRLMPLDRRLVKEGELEFNQFPQMLAYWRSANGPFGVIPPRDWPELFYNLKHSLENPSENPSQQGDAQVEESMMPLQDQEGQEDMSQMEQVEQEDDNGNEIPLIGSS